MKLLFLMASPAKFELAFPPWKGATLWKVAPFFTSPVRRRSAAPLRGRECRIVGWRLSKSNRRTCKAPASGRPLARGSSKNLTARPSAWSRKFTRAL